ncbi:hypothetical protein SRB5_12580 [Streptomyces sp. RB5]|uniref:Uncharacterized protein n=1 Tax=Streptomyces smaragdinus TaxID=2585196 RepID=A0A7K0CEF0_9ACTN|nr:hypothetical protein [Streptomyces smaragdinus]MQY11144.1 hypothetical protein [Streptomyces smaragdinus]
MGGGRRAVDGVAAVLLFALTVLAFARLTFADPASYTRALRAVDGYDRAYDEILTDPVVRAELRAGALGIPLRSDVVIDNLPLLVPRPALEAAGDRAATALTSYLTGRTGSVSRQELLRPLAHSAQAAGERQLTALRADAEPRTAERLDELARDLKEVPAEQWRSGDASAALRPPLNAFVTDTWDPRTAARINGVLDPLLQVLGGSGSPSDDGAKPPSPSAPLLAAAPAARVAAPASAGPTVGFGYLRPVLIVAGSGPAFIAVLLVTAAVGLLAVRSSAAPVRTAATVCAGAAVLASGAGLLAWALLPAPAEPAPGLPPSVGALLADVTARLYAAAAERWALAVVALTAAAVLLPTLHRRSRRRSLAAGTLVAAQLALLPAVPPTAAAAGPLCDGSAELCDRPYDRVVQIGAHNAMATVADGFLNAHHDQTITGQLDRGVRALLLDTHYWETGETLLPPGLGLRGPTRDTLVRAVDDVVTARRGTWLCHGPCRLGASGLTAQLRAIGRWLDAHPRDVVTLIVQDGITPAATERAFREAGLTRLLARPPADPTGPWPTLGTMIRRGQRLVVFAEQADGPMPWYPNLYRYATETPYQIADPEQLDCAPNRGGAGHAKRIFLLNHFVTRDRSADRAAAARINQPEFIVGRARLCARLRGRLPTVIAVNHVQLGDAVEAARRLNRVS